MKCRCGFSFVKARLEGKEFERFALINDKAYRKLLRAEMKVRQARDRLSKLKAIARASKYVGSVMKCPRCSRIAVLSPGTHSQKHYKLDR